MDPEKFKQEFKPNLQIPFRGNMNKKPKLKISKALETIKHVVPKTSSSAVTTPLKKRGLDILNRSVKSNMGGPNLDLKIESINTR
mmetsp:Transcript_18262/g.17390  ORF Transcript_18262/g.17390 Transcript_18262/m.17390 type:complete len:85 (-) Transcript_18262:66-320(-)